LTDGEFVDVRLEGARLGTKLPDGISDCSSLSNWLADGIFDTRVGPELVGKEAGAVVVEIIDSVGKLEGILLGKLLPDGKVDGSLLGLLLTVGRLESADPCITSTVGEIVDERLDDAKLGIELPDGRSDGSALGVWLAEGILEMRVGTESIGEETGANAVEGVLLGKLLPDGKVDGSLLGSVLIVGRSESADPCTEFAVGDSEDAFWFDGTWLPNGKFERTEGCLDGMLLGKLLPDGMLDGSALGLLLLDGTLERRIKLTLGE